MIDVPILQSSVRRIVDLLADGEYEVVAAMTRNDRYTAEELEQAITSYGRTLVLPPGDGLPPDLDLIDIEGSSPRAVAAVMNLWTAEEGRPDLSLELTFAEAAPRLWLSRIDNLHVM